MAQGGLYAQLYETQFSRETAAVRGVDGDEAPFSFTPNG
jgi:hypothetical protein